MSFGLLMCIMSVISSDVWQGCTTSIFRVTWFGTGGCEGMGWKNMCQLYRKVWGSLSNHSNGQESAERTCLFPLLHSWICLLAQDQVISPLPLSVAVIAHMSSNLPTLTPFHPPHHFSIPPVPIHSPWRWVHDISTGHQNQQRSLQLVIIHHMKNSCHETLKT